MHEMFEATFPHPECIHIPHLLERQQRQKVKS
jgi:hypothetical protein